MNERTDAANAAELDLYLSFTWPESIERSLRKLIILSLLKLANRERATNCSEAYCNFRFQIASFPGTPPEVLAYLATLTDERLLARVAENPQVDIETLAHLAISKHTGVRVAVAENCNATLDILTLLAADQSPDVRYSLAENHALPVAMLRLLSLDENPYVADRALRTTRRHVPVQYLLFATRTRLATIC